MKENYNMSDLLKSAIADAKAVRATALANAKAALEEAFGPRLKEMLSAKLEEEGGDDLGVPPADAASSEEAPVVADEAPVDEVPAEAAPESEEVPLAETLKANTPDPQGASNEVSKGMKKDDKNVTQDLSGSELKQKSVLKADTADPQGEGKEVTDGAKKDDKNLTSDLKAESVVSPADADLKEVVDELEKAVDGSEEAPITEDEDVEINIDGEGEGAPVESADEAEGEKAEVDEEFNLEEILKELEDESAEGSEMTEPCVKEDAPNIDDINKWNALNEEKKKLETENAEYKKAITEIRTQLDEVNLLNAKLLYTNKLFKSYNLSNSQKMKVVESFDLTKCVREVKLIYATLAESFNFGATSKKSFITEGLASKTVASTKPAPEKTQILAEGVEMANRFKKLAGIKAKK